MGVDEGYQIIRKRKNEYKKPNEVKKKIKYNIDDKKKTIKFEKSVETLEELIKLGLSYDASCEYNCVISIELLNKNSTELKSINNMIGLTDFKKTLVKHVLFLLLDEKSEEDLNVRHIILYGSPGTGKTTIAKILGGIYAKIGMLDENKFKIAKRTDFVAKYEGQTEHKTKKYLESFLGRYCLLMKHIHWVLIERFIFDNSYRYIK